MNIRKPVVAGQFYPMDKDQCSQTIQQCLMARKIKENTLPQNPSGGIVPHAGWVFSGDLAAMTLNALHLKRKNIGTFIIFGAAHRYMDCTAAVYDSGKWQTPLADARIDSELAKAIISECPKYAKSDCASHRSEHSIEVVVPFIQYLFPYAKIVPILTAPKQTAIELGKHTAKCVKSLCRDDVAAIGSTDLTHYGPRYGFAPAGEGDEGIKWAKEVNDQNLLDAILAMDSEKTLELANSSTSACGAGAVAAVIEFCKIMGSQKPVLLEHTHSSEVMKLRYNQSSEESVGYASIVF